MQRSNRAQRQRLILVEDDVDLRQGLADYLRLCNFTVEAVGSGSEFHAAMRKASYDVAILDINLPDVSGFELAQSVSSRGGTGVILLTARNSKQDRVRAYQDGADIYLSKPVDSEELALAAWNLGLRVRRERQSRLGNAVVAGGPDGAIAVKGASVVSASMKEGAVDSNGGTGGEIPSPGNSIWTLDRIRQVLDCPNGVVLPVSGKEAIILETLALNEGTRLSRTDMLKAYGTNDDGTDSRKLDVALGRLRAKARDAGVELPIQIVRGAGIRLLETIKLV
ncbi:response regulator transcription factor [Cereibacter changlensis]|uniref:Response regulator transcription factor n=1 Tax=Cereibacter changlensis TaxID=402884 RepID=A0A4V5NLV7_9RHOB|nr:response regulator transcription factor [Cereibacter changlensis]TKA97167.1 response regulator transcription factor [Cereibacter changlensis]